MGLIGNVKALAQLPSKLKAAEVETARLLVVSNIERDVLRAAGHPATAFLDVSMPDAAAAAAQIAEATKGVRTFDLSGLAVGDTFSFARDMKLAGITGVKGQAVVESVAPNHLKVAISGSLAGHSADFGIEIRRLDAGLAEFRIGGFGSGQPLLATIADAHTGSTTIRALGAQDGDFVGIAMTSKGLELSVPFAGEMSTLRLVRS